jgi:Tol biopolymer transport system component
LLRRCLERERTQRLQAIGEARIILAGPLVEEPRVSVAAPPRRPITWIVAATAVLALVALAVVHFRETPPLAPQPLRFSVYPPAKTTLDTFALSPDGRSLAMSVSAEGKDSLWLQRLDALEPQRLPGTDGARFPFWSPDSRYIGFFAEGKLKKIQFTGGLAQTICDSASALGGAWNQDGTILFTPSMGGEMYRVSAGGGVPVPLFNRSGGTAARFASFFPDGRRFLYYGGVGGGIHTGSLDTGAGPQLLIESSNAVYAPGTTRDTGHILFVRNGTLMAQPFDTRRFAVAGDLVPVAEGIIPGSRNAIYQRFSVSPTGVLAYWAGRDMGGNQLTWFDRSGKRLATLGEPGPYRNLSLSPDQKKVAVSRMDRTSSDTPDIWVLDVARGSASRLTFDPGIDDFPVWSSDGGRLAYLGVRGSEYGIYQKAAAGTGSEELLFKSPEAPNFRDWSGDGRYFVYQARLNRPRGFDLWLLPLGGDRKPFPFVQNEFTKADARFSPDGRWLAYASFETGRFEIYVQPVPNSGAPVGGARWQISTAGGQEPVWRSDGKELFYLDTNLRLMAVPIKAGAAIEAGKPRTLFETRAIPPGPTISRSYDVTADGQRFLINTMLGDAEQRPITVVVNWQAGLGR